MKNKKCLGCGKEKSLYINQGILLCSVCNHVVNLKIKENFQKGKTTKVLDIIMELNEWSENELFHNHKEMIKE